MLKVTFLGTGTSQGIPVISCPCETCASLDVKDHRLRSSILLTIANQNIVIDVGPDFRQQMLANHVKSLGAILLTHEHNDHVAGLDDIRPFNFRQGYDMPIYGLPRVIDDIKARFGYVFNEAPYPGIPKVVLKSLEANQKIELLGAFPIETIAVSHGKLPILAYRIFDFAYVTDASYLDALAMSQLENLDVLVLNALQYKKHYAHYTYDEAIEIALKLNAKTTYFTHMSHDMGKHQMLLDRLPPRVKPAYDGLVLEL